MKKYIILFCFMFAATCWAQTGNEKEFSKENFLSAFGAYFEDAQMNDTGLIRLQAKKIFDSIPDEKRSSIMELVLSKGYALASVSYGSKRELWQKDANSGAAVAIESWDLDNLQKPELRTLEKTDLHPWFLYFGTNSSINSDMVNLNIGFRIGSFLLKDQWDLAFSISPTFSGGTSDNSSNIMIDIGLMSKYYYPVTIQKRYRVSPYAGLGISYLGSSVDDGNEVQHTGTWTVPFYLGFSWFVGPGSLDLGLQFSKNTVFMVGYTFSPWKKQ